MNKIIIIIALFTTAAIALYAENDQHSRLINENTATVNSDRLTLITSIKLINAEELQGLTIQSILENGVGIQSEDSSEVKNISSFTICASAECAARDGKTVNADFVVFGTLTKIKKSSMQSLGDTNEDQYIARRVYEIKYILELKLLDTASGKIAAETKKTTGNTDTLKSITNEFIRKTKKFYRVKK